jgi:hypothetical protein
MISYLESDLNGQFSWKFIEFFLTWCSTCELASVVLDSENWLDGEIILNKWIFVWMESVSIISWTFKGYVRFAGRTTYLMMCHILIGRDCSPWSHSWEKWLKWRILSFGCKPGYQTMYAVGVFRNFLFSFWSLNIFLFNILNFDVELIRLFRGLCDIG